MWEQGLIDMHAHCLPPAYLEAARRAALSDFDGGVPIPDWTPATALAFMDRHHIAIQVLSLASPPVCVLAPHTVAALARQANDEIAEIAAAHPDRFAATAVLPLPDVDAALEAIDHCFDLLGMQGATLFTHYGGRYLGDPVFEPVWAALDRRAALVLLHPTSPPDAERARLGRPTPLVEFPLDTTRAVVDLVYAGIVARYRRVRIVVPHAGAAVPVLAWRIARFAGDLPMPGRPEAITPDTVLGQIRSLYYDVALGANEPALAALLTVADPDRIVFGSDYPYAPETAVRVNTASLASSPRLNDPARERIGRRTALDLLPALRRERLRRPDHIGGTHARTQ